MTHLFALSTSAADIMNISLRSRLSAARLTYIDSLHGTSRQQSFTASLLLDEAIRLCCPSVPRPLDIAANENGQPYLTAAPDVHFSLSHSAAWAVCAVSDHPVGVDIQQCRSFKPNIADRFFHPDEVQYLSSLSPAERENAFLHAVGAQGKLRQGRRPRSAAAAAVLRRYRLSAAGNHRRRTRLPVCAEFPRSRLQARRMRAEKKREIAHSNRFTAAFHPIKRKKNRYHKVSVLSVYSDSFALRTAVAS